MGEGHCPSRIRRRTMKKIQFDSGMQEYSVNGNGILRFHPGDPNVYARFLDAADKIQKAVEELTEQAKMQEEKNDNHTIVKLMAEADQKVKDILGWVFGGDNDFDKIMGGINLLAAADNGEQVITNLLAALQPILVEGAERCAREQTAMAVEKANRRREGR